MTIQQVRHFALTLPEATEEPHFDLTSFRVRGKIFATAPPGGEFLHVFVPAEVREVALAEEPDFLGELRWGTKIVGLRVVLASAKPQAVNTLLSRAWSGKAPKKLLAEAMNGQLECRSRLGEGGSPV